MSTHTLSWLFMISVQSLFGRISVSCLHRKPWCSSMAESLSSMRAEMSASYFILHDEWPNGSRMLQAASTIKWTLIKWGSMCSHCSVRWRLYTGKLPLVPLVAIAPNKAAIGNHLPSQTTDVLIVKCYRPKYHFCNHKSLLFFAKTGNNNNSAFKIFWNTLSAQTRISSGRAFCCHITIFPTQTYNKIFVVTKIFIS